MNEFPQIDLGLAILVFTQGDDLIACLNKLMAFYTVAIIQDDMITMQQVQGRQGQSYAGTGYKGNATSSRGNNEGGQTRVVKCYNCQGEGHMASQILDEEQLAFLADPGIPGDQAAQTTITNTAAFKTKDLDAYDFDCDDVSNAKAVLMANLSNYGSDVISERYKEELKTFEQRLNFDLSTREKMIDSQMDDMIREKLALKQQINSLKQNLSNQSKEKESLLQTFTVFKNESKEMESKYMDKEIDLEKKIKELDNIVYKVVNLLKQCTYFGKHFVPQQELSAEQAFWLQTSHLNTDQSASSPVKIEAPKELPKVKLVNTSLNKLKYHLGQFDTAVKKRITPDAITEGEWGSNSKKGFCDIQTLQNELRKLKGKNVLDNATTITNATTFAPGMFKLDLDPLAPRLLKNRDAYIDYLKYTQEQADILRGISEQAKVKQPLDNALDFSCKHAKRIQELLVYVRDTCPTAECVCV
ncbi:retrovirus-related pol polyprotein from transposon TNT 1-94 [Tanacetum coccineum]